MSAAIAIAGIVVGVIIMCILLFRGVHPFVAAIIGSVIIAITGQDGLYDALKNQYMGGFADFFGSNFLIFVAGALFGKVFEITNAAKSIANMLVKACGKRFALIGLSLATGIMSYAGIVGFVLCFAVWPIAVEICRESDIPRRFAPAAIVMGCVTYSGFGPFNAQVANVAVASSLGTDLGAAWKVSLIGVAFSVVITAVILMTLIARARSKGEHFVALESDGANASGTENLPNGLLALIPIVVTVLLINIKVGGSAILQPEFGVFVGAVLAYALMFRHVAKDGVSLWKRAAEAVVNAIGAAAGTSAMVAIGSVVKVSAGWDTMIGAIVNIPGPPLVAVAVGGMVMGAIMGSGTGAAGLTAPMFQPIFGPLGVSPVALHRTIVASTLAGGTLPNCGFFNTMILGIAKSNYKECYGPIFWTCPFSNFLSTIVMVVLMSVFPSLV
ncbi:MAG TPA: hypothetical protein VFQ54_09390 [Thermomicrobiales bacterium]|nr:hypothetical protein [Thermomicrobiales bacterium]